MYRTAYPALRASLDPGYVEISDEQLDALVAEIYGTGVSAEDVEAFWNDLGRGFSNVAQSVGRFAQRAAPVLGRALPSIAQGALSGATVGGPIGAIVGAAAGGAGGVLSQSRNRTLRGIGGAIGGATQLASSFTGGGALRNLAGVALGGGGRGGALGGLAGTALGALGRQGGAAGAISRVAGQFAPQLAGLFGGGGGGSANALLGLLSRPETVRALSAAAMGPYGRTQVPVGSQAVPVQSILGALGTLAGRAASEAEAAGEQAFPDYFYAADGELAIDPADAEQRAEALLELFASTPSRYVERAAREYDEYDEAGYSDEDAAYDEWLLANEAVWSEDGEFDGEAWEYDEYEEYDHA